MNTKRLTKTLFKDSHSDLETRHPCPEAHRSTVLHKLLPTRIHQPRQATRPILSLSRKQSYISRLSSRYQVSESVDIQTPPGLLPPLHVSSHSPLKSRTQLLKLTAVLEQTIGDADRSRDRTRSCTSTPNLTRSFSVPSMLFQTNFIHWGMT